MIRKTKSLEERFWAKVQKTEGCWYWTGAKLRSGYGVIGLGRRQKGNTKLAHRLSYEWTHGPLPEAAQVCHHCDTPCCVRPDHLFPGSQRDNVQDCVRKGRHVPGRGSLTPTEVDVIRLRHQAGVSQRQLSRTFGVSVRQIGRILRYENWTKHTSS